MSTQQYKTRIGAEIPWSQLGAAFVKGFLITGAIVTVVFGSMYCIDTWLESRMAKDEAWFKEYLAKDEAWFKAFLAKDEALFKELMDAKERLAEKEALIKQCMGASDVRIDLTPSE